MSETKVLDRGIVRNLLSPDLFISREICTNADDAMEPGVYTMYSDGANTPIKDSGFIITFPKNSANSLVQVVIAAWNTRIIWRTYWNGTWYSWKELTGTKLAASATSESGRGNTLHFNAFRAERRAA